MFCYTLTLVWHKGTKTEIRDLFWSKDDANRAAHTFLRSLANPVWVKVLQGGPAACAQASVLLRGGDVFVCVDPLTEDTLRFCSLQQIKDLMRKRRLSVSGSKRELIRRIKCSLGYVPLLTGASSTGNGGVGCQ